MQPTIKRSRQRDAILAYLRTRTDHPTAEAVYTALRESMPNISLGTVYRNLALLADYGTILRISCDGKVDHFDANTAPHPHFLCEICGRVDDITAPLPCNPMECISPDFKGIPHSYSLIYYGTCPRCRKTPS